MSLFGELQRRNVFRVAAAYVVVGWLLIEIVTTLVPVIGAPEWVSQVVLLLVALGFIPAVIFAWVYELTPEGLKRESDVRRDDSITGDTGRKLNYVTIGAVICLIAFFGWSRLDQSTTQQTPAPADAVLGDASVAVLPFVSMSDSRENEFFSDGLSETLMHMLAQIPDLKVAARTSSFAFKGADRDIRDIASALGVAHVLEGSVQRAGNKVRITAQLVRASDGFHVWSQNFDRELTDIFRIQDEIATRVGDALSASLLGDGDTRELHGVGTDNLEALDLYYEAIALVPVGSFEALKESEYLLKQALSRDPDFLDAKTELATVYVGQWNTGLKPIDEAVTDVLALTSQVLEVDPGNARAKTAELAIKTFQGFLAGEFERIREALVELEEIAREAPNEIAPRFFQAQFLSGLGDHGRLMEVIREALDIDPLNVEFLLMLYQAHHDRKDWVSAESALQRALEVQPDRPSTYSRLAHVADHVGDARKSVEFKLKAAEIDRQDPDMIGDAILFLYAFGLVDEGDAFMDRLIAVAPNSPMTRKVQLARAVAAGVEGEAERLARRIIENDFDNRVGAGIDAVEIVARNAALAGTVDETMQYLDRQAPGFSDYENENVPYHVVLPRYIMLGPLATVRSQEEMAVLVEQALRPRERLGLEDVRELPRDLAYVSALTGDKAAAIEGLTRYLEEPVTYRTGWRHFLAEPIFEDLLDDPAIQQGIAWSEKQDAQARDVIRQFLAERSDQDH